MAQSLMQAASPIQGSGPKECRTAEVKIVNQTDQCMLATSLMANIKGKERCLFQMAACSRASSTKAYRTVPAFSKHRMAMSSRATSIKENVKVRANLPCLMAIHMKALLRVECLMVLANLRALAETYTKEKLLKRADRDEASSLLLTVRPWMGSGITICHTAISLRSSPMERLATLANLRKVRAKDRARWSWQLAKSMRVSSTKVCLKVRAGLPSQASATMRAISATMRTTLSES